MIANNDEAKRSKIWRVVTLVSSVLIILIAVYLLTRMFTTNPVVGNWESEDATIALKIEKNDTIQVDITDIAVTDMPTATGAAIAYDDLKVLDFSGTDGDFKFSEEEREENVNIGISVRKGNTVLKEAIDSYLDTLTVDDFNAIMDEAIKVQPLGE